MGNSSIGENMQEVEGTESVVLPGQKNVESKGMKNHQFFRLIT